MVAFGVSRPSSPNARGAVSLGPPLLMRAFFRGFLLCLSVVASRGAPGSENREPPVAVTEANVMTEITFTAAGTYAHPFRDVVLDAIFTDPSGRESRVPAFWAGGQSWKVRYASPLVGSHRYRTVSSRAEDAGLQDRTGTVRVGPYTGKNPLYLHGPLKVSANRRYLEYGDGRPFFWLGDTWWMGLVKRLRWPEEFQALAADRKAKGFNVVQIVAGLYPDMPPFDPRGANEGGFPWSADYAEIRPEYFDAADVRLRYLVDEGFTPCIVGLWGYFLPWMGVEKAKEHWRNLIARYGALPVVWCIAGEANLPYYLAPNFPADDRSQVKGWTEVARYVREADPFHRLVTIHPTGINRLSARNAIDDVSLLDIDLLQTPHAQRAAVAPTVNTVRESYADRPVLPVIDGEPAYEMLNDVIPAEWSRRMFWLCLMNGAAGHTYGANGIWQVNRRGQPFGPSPNGAPGSVGYGVIAWDEAMRLAGSSHVAIGKRFFEQFPWQDLMPHPEWAEFADASPFDFRGARWIWYPEGEPAVNAPAEKRYFRGRFFLPENRPVKRARLFISADGYFHARVNRRTAGTGNGLGFCREFEDLSHLLKPGENFLAAMVDNLATEGARNPAGLIIRFDVIFADGGVQTVVTDGTWRTDKANPLGWDGEAGFDDHAWKPVEVVAEYGAKPWGRLAPPNRNDVDGPQSAGLPDGTRITYVPEVGGVKLLRLDSGARYAVEFFDPVTGTRKALPAVDPGPDGSLVISSPPGYDHDWVLIVQPGVKRP